MAREVAERNGVHMDETFTGFKFMAEKTGRIRGADSYEYLMAFEESCGYMMGDYVRDKDAVTASLMITEMAASYFLQGKTLLDALDGLYAQYGYFGEQTLNLMMPAWTAVKKCRPLCRGCGKIRRMISPEGRSSECGITKRARSASPAWAPWGKRRFPAATCCI
jgi:phosphoglucomutase